MQYRKVENVIDLHSTVIASNEQISTDMPGETVILSVTDSVYYGLDDVGAFIWQTVQQPVTVDQIIEAVLETYDVDRPTAQADTLSLINELHARRLIQVLS